MDTAFPVMSPLATAAIRLAPVAVLLIVAWFAGPAILRGTATATGAALRLALRGAHVVARTAARRKAETSRWACARCCSYTVLESRCYRCGAPRAAAEIAGAGRPLA
jgi:hypothetical protein